MSPCLGPVGSNLSWAPGLAQRGVLWPLRWSALRQITDHNPLPRGSATHKFLLKFLVPMSELFLPPEVSNPGSGEGIGGGGSELCVCVGAHLLRLSRPVRLSCLSRPSCPSRLVRLPCWLPPNQFRRLVSRFNQNAVGSASPAVFWPVAIF